MLKVELQGVPLEHISSQITSDNLESLVIVALFSSDFSFFLRYQKSMIDSWLPGKIRWRLTLVFKQRCILLKISMKIWNLIHISSFHPNFLMTFPCDDYVLWMSDWGLPQMWLHESLIKEFLYRCLESMLGAGVMEGV